MRPRFPTVSVQVGRFAHRTPPPMLPHAMMVRPHDAQEKKLIAAVSVVEPRPSIWQRLRAWNARIEGCWIGDVIAGLGLFVLLITGLFYAAVFA